MHFRSMDRPTYLVREATGRSTPTEPAVNRTPVTSAIDADAIEFEWRGLDCSVVPWDTEIFGFAVAQITRVDLGMPAAAIVRRVRRRSTRGARIERPPRLVPARSHAACANRWHSKRTGSGSSRWSTSRASRHSMPSVRRQHSIEVRDATLDELSAIEGVASTPSRRADSCSIAGCRPISATGVTRPGCGPHSRARSQHVLKAEIDGDARRVLHRGATSGRERLLAPDGGRAQAGRERASGSACGRRCCAGTRGGRRIRRDDDLRPQPGGAQPVCAPGVLIPIGPDDLPPAGGTGHMRVCIACGSSNLGDDWECDGLPRSSRTGWMGSRRSPRRWPTENARLPGVVLRRTGRPRGEQLLVPRAQRPHRLGDAELRPGLPAIPRDRMRHGVRAERDPSRVSVGRSRRQRGLQRGSCDSPPRRVPSATFYQMDARHIPFRDHFDAIGAFDVLEHIEDDVAVIEEVGRALRPDGMFVMTVPQHPALWSPQDDHAYHVRRYTSRRPPAQARSGRVRGRSG